MPRYASTVPGDWYLRDWMKERGLTQAKLRARTGWSKATMNDLFHGRTDYYRARLDEAARGLDLEPFELLLPPAEAKALRAVRDAARMLTNANSRAR